MEAAPKDPYDHVARIYDAISQLYSLGQIRACKRWQLHAIAPGDRVLYAGVGHGEDAALAARHGARVTVIDRSPRMLARARSRFRASEVEALVETIQGDLFQHRREDGYDAVAANFFLNSFAEPEMRAAFAHLVGLIRPGGKLLIADFAPPGPGLLAHTARWLYFGAAVLTFRVLVGTPLHALHDYTALLPEAGLRLEECREFRLLGGPAFYRTLVATRAS